MISFVAHIGAPPTLGYPPLLRNHLVHCRHWVAPCCSLIGFLLSLTHLCLALSLSSKVSGAYFTHRTSDYSCLSIYYLSFSVAIYTVTIQHSPPRSQSHSFISLQTVQCPSGLFSSHLSISSLDHISGGVEATS